MSEKTDYGIINVENKGNTSTFADFFHYGDELPEPNSDGNPHFEGSPWGIDDFYLAHKGQTISLKNERIFRPFDIPRHAEVIDGKAYVIAGEYNYPNSERYEEYRSTVLNLNNENARDIKVADGIWMIAEIDLEERTEKVNLMKNPRGNEFWSYNELQNDDLANKILNGVDDSISTSPTDELKGGSTEAIEAPRKFNKKTADKITNFNPSTDTLEIEIDSFGIDSSATFASGKNKKAVKKKLAKQDFDFLYDEKKGGLYFNENGSDKGFGEGGIIAILKGAPDLTPDNLEFI